MRTITKEYQIYKFDELSEESQERAISDHIQFEIEIYGGSMEPKLSVIHDSVLESERLHTPWFLPEIVYEDHKQDIIDAIQINQYGFYEDGGLIGADMYPDNWEE